MKKANEEKINEIAAKLVQENLPDVYETVRNVVCTVKRISEKAKENIKKVTDKEMQYKKDNNRTNENLLRSVGIFPTQHPSFVFNQYNDNRQQQNIQISQRMQNVIGESIHKKLEKIADDWEGA